MQALFNNSEIIYAYTRQEALADGEQVLVNSNISREAGYKYPVYLTRSVHDLIVRSAENKRTATDYEGVLWDILWMSKFQKKGFFTVIILGVGRKRNHVLFVEVGPQDIYDPTPVVTIMTPSDR